MKRLTFKKPFNGMDNAIKLIPESYKVDGKEFQITDGVETYDVRWDINEATVLRAENKNLINEDMAHMKHLMGFNSKETLGTLKGTERIDENKSFGDVWNKTKKLLSESEEVEEGKGLIKESVGEEDELPAPPQEIEVDLEESLASKVVKAAHAENPDLDPRTFEPEKEIADVVGKSADAGAAIAESEDVDKYMDAKADMNKLDTLASKVNTRDEKVEAGLEELKNIAGDDKALINKIAREAMKMANELSEEESCDECDMMEEEAPVVDIEESEMDRLDQIFEGWGEDED